MFLLWIHNNLSSPTESPFRPYVGRCIDHVTVGGLPFIASLLKLSYFHWNDLVRMPRPPSDTRPPTLPVHDLSLRCFKSLVLFHLQKVCVLCLMLCSCFVPRSPSSNLSSVSICSAAPSPFFFASLQVQQETLPRCICSHCHLLYLLLHHYLIPAVSWSHSTSCASPPAPLPLFAGPMGAGGGGWRCLWLLHGCGRSRGRAVLELESAGCTGK